MIKTFFLKFIYFSRDFFNILFNKIKRIMHFIKKINNKVLSNHIKINSNSKLYSISATFILGPLSQIVKEHDTPEKINKFFDETVKEPVSTEMKRFIYGHGNLARFITRSKVMEWLHSPETAEKLKNNEMVFTKEDKFYMRRHVGLLIDIRDKYMLQDPTGVKYQAFRTAIHNQESEFLRNLCLHMLETNFDYDTYRDLKLDMFNPNTDTVMEAVEIDNLIFSFIDMQHELLLKIVENVDNPEIDEIAFFNTIKDTPSIATEVAEDTNLSETATMESLYKEVSGIPTDKFGYYHKYDKEFCLISAKWQNIQQDKKIVDELSSIKSFSDAFYFVSKHFYEDNDQVHFHSHELKWFFEKFEPVWDKDFFSLETFKYLYGNTPNPASVSEENVQCLEYVENFYRTMFFHLYQNSSFFETYFYNSNIDSGTIYTNINTVANYMWPSISIILTISYIILSYYYLITSKNAISAIVSFFIQILGFTFIFFYMSNEYVGSIILMIYLGAIIIFFVFILFSSDPKKFSMIYFNSKFKKSINIGFILIFTVYFIIFYFSFKHFMIPHYKKPMIISKDKFKSDKTVTDTIGDIIFNIYPYQVSILGILLLIALFGSLKMINPKKKKNKFIFKKKIFKKKNELYTNTRYLYYFLAYYAFSRI